MRECKKIIPSKEVKKMFTLQIKVGNNNNGIRSIIIQKNNDEEKSFPIGECYKMIEKNGKEYFEENLLQNEILHILNDIKDYIKDYIKDDIKNEIYKILE